MVKHFVIVITTHWIHCFLIFVLYSIEDAFVIPPKVPNLDTLVNGPGAFRANNSDELFSIIANYVAKFYGMTFIEKWLTNNKGRSVLEMITVLDIAYAITIIKNHELV